MPPYQYGDYHNPFVGSISDLMLRRGDIAAAAANRMGAIEAQRATAVGGAIGGGIAQAGGEISGAMQRQNDPQRQLAQQQVDANKRSLAYQDTASKIAQSLMGPNGESPDPDKVQALLVAAKIPISMHKSILDPFESMQSHHKEAMADAGAIAYRVLKTLPPDASADDRGHAAAAALGAAGASGLVQKDEAKKLLDAIAGGTDPTGLALSFMGASPSGRYKETIQDETKPITIPATPRGGAPARVITPGGQTLGTGAPSPAQPPTPASIAMDAAGGSSQATAANALLHPAAARSLQRASGMLDGKRADVLVDTDPKATQKVFDLNGKPIDNAAERFAPMPPASTIINPQAASDVKESVAGMIDGTLPPQLPGRATKEYLATLAEAHRQGYDLKTAVLDFNATQKHVATMNGVKFTNLLTSIQTASDSLDVIQKLADQWQGGRFPLLNKANLALAKGGAYGKDAASIANQLEGQITDVTSELGNVYMGGNSPTDHALKLAEKNLKGEWDQKVLTDMIGLARTNLRIRGNSIKNSAPILPNSQQQQNDTADGFIYAQNAKGEVQRAKLGTAVPDGWKVVPKPEWWK